MAGLVALAVVIALHQRITSRRPVPPSPAPQYPPSSDIYDDPDVHPHRTYSRLAHTYEDTSLKVQFPPPRPLDDQYNDPQQLFETEPARPTYTPVHRTASQSDAELRSESSTSGFGFHEVRPVLPAPDYDSDDIAQRMLESYTSLHDQPFRPTKQLDEHDLNESTETNVDQLSLQRQTTKFDQPPEHAPPAPSAAISASFTADDATLFGFNASGAVLQHKPTSSDTSNSDQDFAFYGVNGTLLNAALASGPAYLPTEPVTRWNPSFIDDDDAGTSI